MADRRTSTPARSGCMVALRYPNAWACPAMPAPTTATVTCLPMGSPDSYGVEGLARARGDGIGTVEIARVQVLLDDHEGAGRHRPERGGQVVERGDAEARLAHHVSLHGVGERQLLGLDLGEHAGIDGLEVEVPD